MSVVPTFRVLATSCWLAPLLLAGCLGGQTGTEEWVDRGGEGPGSPTNGEGSGCEDEEQDVASDDASLGFAFDDVAAFVIGEHSTDLAWGNATSSVSFGPESGIGSLALGIDWTGGVKRIHSVPRYDDSGAEGPAIGILCPPDRLAADVTLRLTSGGGAFAESVPARIVVESAGRAELEAAIPIDQVQGAFRVTLGPDSITRAVGIRAAFTEAGFAGDFNGSIETNHGDAASQGGVIYARFPAQNPCNTNTLEVPVPLTAPGASELAGLLTELRNGERPLAWKTGATTAIDFEVTPAEVACQAGDDFTGSGAGLSLPLALALRTRDGRVDTMLAGSVSTSDGATSLRAGRTCEGPDVAEQAELCGVRDVNTSGYTNLSLSLSATFAAGGVFRGNLDVLGIPVTNCQPTPQSSCGSPGAMSIETGSF
jgi:hypothetical protein